MNEDQRKGLSELAEWRASLRTDRSARSAGDTAAAASDTAVVTVDEGPVTTSGNGEATDVDVKRTAATDTDVADTVDVHDDGDAEHDDGDAEHDEDGEDDEGGRKRRALVDWLIVMGVALLAAVLIRTYVFAHFVVDGTSMVTTLESGDRVFVNKLSYRLHDPRRGDVVVLHEIDSTAQRDLIKRVIALPGESIEMRSCQVLVNGDLLIEPYLDPAVVRPGNCGSDFAPVTVEDDHVFVMGDNRAGSMDSRVLGTIDDDDLVGRAFVVFWPTSNWRWL